MKPSPAEAGTHKHLILVALSEQSLTSKELLAVLGEHMSWGTLKAELGNMRRLHGFVSGAKILGFRGTAYRWSITDAGCRRLAGMEPVSDPRAGALSLAQHWPIPASFPPAVCRGVIRHELMRGDA